MSITFREMIPAERKKVTGVARSSFGIVESLFMAKPKNAVLAEENGEILGGIAYKVFSGSGSRKIGYAETAFVARSHAGKGIGSQLYREATKALQDRGCETVITMVRDDNVASWKAFENSGYNRVTFSQVLFQLGLFRFLWFWFCGLNCIAVGHELWATLPQKPSTSLRQIALYLVLVVITLLPALRFGLSFDRFGSSVIGILALLLAAMLGGTLTAVLTKQKWKFRVTRGGLLLSLVIAALGGVFPIVGRYYPEKYSRSSDFRRAMGLEGFSRWLAVLLLLLLSVYLHDTSVIWASIQSFGTSILLYHALPVFPFGSYGGTRIWNYNKGLSLAVLLVSVSLMYLF